MDNKVRKTWTSNLGFMLAAAGSAIGLGNIWKFPYIVGANGGGAFVFVYLACILLVGVPVLVAEMFIGHRGQGNTVASYNKLHKSNRFWQLAGWLGLSSAFLILSYYSVIGGWIIDFEVRSLMNDFAGMDEAQIKNILPQIFSDPLRQALFLSIFSLLTVGIVRLGVQKGIEKWNKILMPALVIVLFLLLANCMFLPGFFPALKFLFYPDLSKLNYASILEAIGHAFFTLSVGVGVMVTFGSYLKTGTNFVRMGVTLALVDTFLALLAGIVVFSCVFSFDIEPSVGPTLIFETLPILFSKISGGYFFSVSFFLLVSFTALTSSISILEVVVAYIEETFEIKRNHATLMIAAAFFVVGFLCVLSFNQMNHVTIFGFSFFDFLDKLTSSLFMPISALLTIIFFSWVLPANKGVEAALERVESRVIKNFFIYCAKFITPLLILTILLLGL